MDAAPVTRLYLPTRLDLLYGLTPMRPEFICRIVPTPWWRLDLRIQEWMEEWDDRFRARYAKWKCTWCGAPSDPPSGNEVMVCPKCGTKGCEDSDGY